MLNAVLDLNNGSQHTQFTNYFSMQSDETIFVTNIFQKLANTSSFGFTAWEGVDLTSHIGVEGVLKVTDYIYIYIYIV